MDVYCTVRYNTSCKIQANDAGEVFYQTYESKLYKLADVGTPMTVINSSIGADPRFKIYPGISYIFINTGSTLTLVNFNGSVYKTLSADGQDGTYGTNTGTGSQLKAHTKTRFLLFTLYGVQIFDATNGYSYVDRLPVIYHRICGKT